jgi:hypothetical protein
VASTSGPVVMMAIPMQSGAGVTVVIFPPLSTGREKEIVAPVSPSGGVLSSPVRFRLEEDEGVTPASVDLETEAGPFTEPEEARARGDEHLDQVGGPPKQEVLLDWNQERAMVLASRPSTSASWSIGEWV